MFRRICAVIVPLTLVTIAAVLPARAQGHSCVLPSVASFTVAALAWTPPEPAASQYIVTEVEGLTNVAGINNAGQMIGNDYTSAFLWDEGTIIELGTLGGDGSRAAAINNAGQIVGHSDITQIDPDTGVQLDRPFLWLPEPAYGLPAGMHNLGTLGDDYHSYADDINDFGQVVGHSRPAGLPNTHAFRWQNGVMTDLGSLGAAENTSQAKGINNLGQVVGWSYDDEIVRHAILFDNGQLIDLGSLGGFAWGSNPLSEAFDINEAGQIAGQSFAEPRPGDSQRHVFSWNAGELTDLNELGGYLRSTYVRAINNAGHVIGDTDLHGGVLWKNGRMIDLSDEIAATGWFLYTVQDINDYGQIVGWGKQPAGQTASLLLTPDCNGNGLPDHQEILDDPGLDLNANGIPDGCDPDCNGNGLPDDLDVAAGSSSDLNGNGIPDECGEFDDCNTNGIPDFLDIAAGTRMSCWVSK